MAKARASGADFTMLVCRETTYGTAPTSGYRAMDVRRMTLSSEQPIGEDALLSRGRNAQGAYRGLITDDGQIDIPITVRGTGVWLTALFGDPTVTTVSATGYFAFSAQPAANSTITLNGTTWTFVSGTPSGNQTQIGVSVDATITALATNLNASADAQVAKCTYTANTTDDRLEISFDSPGLSGNSFTLAASTTSNATRSAATMLSGGYRHEWTSGGATIPSYTIEVGHPQLATPVFYRHVGTMLDSIAIDMASDGTPSSAQLQVVAQGETSATTTIDASPDQHTLEVFRKSCAYIQRSGTPIGGVTAGNLNFSNNLERIRTIRCDGLIDGADPTIATCGGDITVRFDNSTLEDVAATGGPIAMTYGMSTHTGWSLVFDIFSAVMSRPRRPIEGPGGVQATYAWVGQYDDTAATMLRVRLLNDVSSYI